METNTNSLLNSLLAETPAMDLSDEAHDVRIASMRPVEKDAVSEVLDVLNANWETELIGAQTIEGHKIPGFAPIRNDTRQPLSGVVSEKYQTVSNREALEPMVQNGYKLLGGGCVDTGRVVRAEFSLGLEHDIRNVPVGDIVRARLVVHIGHDGKTGVRAIGKGYRSRCKNGMVCVDSSMPSPKSKNRGIKPAPFGMFSRACLSKSAARVRLWYLKLILFERLLSR